MDNIKTIFENLKEYTKNNTYSKSPKGETHNMLSFCNNYYYYEFPFETLANIIVLSVIEGYFFEPSITDSEEYVLFGNVKITNFKFYKAPHSINKLLKENGELRIENDILKQKIAKEDNNWWNKLQKIQNELDDLKKERKLNNSCADDMLESSEEDK